MSRERSLQGGVGYSGAQVYILRWCKRGAFGVRGTGADSEWRTDSGVNQTDRTAVLTERD